MENRLQTGAEKLKSKKCVNYNKVGKQISVIIFWDKAKGFVQKQKALNNCSMSIHWETSKCVPSFLLTKNTQWWLHAYKFKKAPPSCYTTISNCKKKQRQKALVCSEKIDWHVHVGVTCTKSCNIYLSFTFPTKKIIKASNTNLFFPCKL